jgi:hypothetical protein
MFRQTAAILLVALACGSLSASAQTTAQSEKRPPTETVSERELQFKLEGVERVAPTEFDRRRESKKARLERARFEAGKHISFHPLSEDDQSMLTPSQGDAALFAAFLSQPGTGLIRLLPREKFASKLEVRGGGAYYSFAHLVHEYNYGSDIELMDNHFASGFAGADYGFLIDLGDVAVEDVTNEMAPVRFMVSFKPYTDEADARKFFRQLFDDGVKDGQFIYKRSVPAIVGHSYALRSVGYGMSDVLVAFRVLRKEEETGALIIVWKTLKKFPETELIRTPATTASQ